MSSVTETSLDVSATAYAGYSDDVQRLLRADRSGPAPLSTNAGCDDASGMRKALPLLVAIAVLASVGAAMLIERSSSCDVLVERDLFDMAMDFDASGGSPTMEEAVEDAFAEAGMPRQVDLSDLDPIVHPHPNGNLVHVGVDGYWIVLATVQEGDGGAWGTPLATEDGFVPVERPRPCSVLDPIAETPRSAG